MPSHATFLSGHSFFFFFDFGLPSSLRPGSFPMTILSKTKDHKISCCPGLTYKSLTISSYISKNFLFSKVPVIANSSTIHGISNLPYVKGGRQCFMVSIASSIKYTFI